MLDFARGGTGLKNQDRLPAAARWHIRGAGEHPTTPHSPHHVIRNAVAMACLICVPASVHVRQVERPDGAQHAGVREELADRDGAAHIDAEHVRAARKEMTDILRRYDALFEKGLVHPARRGRTVRREIRKMHDASGANIFILGIEREKFHPARIDTDERLVRGRRQAGDRPVGALGPARDRNAVWTV